ncbi:MULTISPECIES: class I SAM-dependent methyltransferase [Cohnella]|uniref:class I SAM-dependent methyltransferase n=1 Tax=Cohnella TaxID=329857 RepID=UPI0009BB7DA8|nr:MULTISPECIES: class I SAM-dependent methyltransferase [Cohnella]MBN2981362.1 class I SAM-dependent methyltransferase [Cohnella algarum]
MNSSSYWNEVFDRIRQGGNAKTSSWLRRYLPIRGRDPAASVLEIGCGLGKETAFLVDCGYRVTATDVSETALSAVKSAFPSANLLLHDTRDRFPFPDESFDLAVASLSLHYFGYETMIRILADIRRLLKNGGPILFRLNSANDEDAGKEHPIERYFYRPETCRELFADWREAALREVAEDYYGKTKVMIEGMFEKAPAGHHL